SGALNSPEITVFEPLAKHDLVLGGITLVGKHRRQTFLVVGHQVYTHLRRDFGPLLFADPLQILKVAFSIGGNEGMGFKSNIPSYMATSIVPSMQWSRAVPLAEKQPQRIMFPPPCLTVGTVFLGSYSAFFHSAYFQHSHLTTSCLPILLRIIQVFIGKLQTALYMCFLEQGDLA